MSVGALTLARMAVMTEHPPQCPCGNAGAGGPRGLPALRLHRTVTGRAPQLRECARAGGARMH